MKNPSEHTAAPAGSSRGRAVTIVAAVFAAIAAIALMTIVQGSPTIGDPRIGIDVSRPPEPAETALPPAGESASAATPLPHAVTIIISAVVALVLILILLVIVRAALRALAAGTPRARGAGVGGGGATAAGAPDPDAEVVRRGVDEAIAAFDDPNEPRDAIIAAWVTVERTVAGAGIVRGRSETAGEFARRIIGHRTGADDDAVALLRAYEDVRFGGVAVDDHARARARRHLMRIREVWR